MKSVVQSTFRSLLAISFKNLVSKSAVKQVHSSKLEHSMLISYNLKFTPTY